MNIIKKVISAALLAFSALGLTISPLAFADGKSDAEATCPGCHGIVINGIQAVGTGGKACAQRTAAEWITTIERMNGKGCGVPAGSIAGIASYLAGISPPPPPPPCNNGPAQLINGSWVCPPPRVTCYNPDGTSFFVYSWSLSCPSGTSPTPPPTCSGGLPTFVGSAWICPTTTTTTTTTTPLTCYKPSADGLSYITEVSYIGFCSSGWAYSPPPPCPGGTLSIVQNHMWQCSVGTSSTTSTTTTSSTTSTTLCNTYVNGTTQYKYSGSGSCHSFANDDGTGLHIERDQAYCKKHMSHFNSKGNHVHASSHSVCM